MVNGNAASNWQQKLAADFPSLIVITQVGLRARSFYLLNGWVAYAVMFLDNIS